MRALHVWMGLALVGWIGLGWSVGRRAQDHEHATGIDGQFKVTTVSTNGESLTTITRRSTGEILWEELNYSSNRTNPDARGFFYGGKAVAITFKSPGKLPSFEFSFFGADGRCVERWMAGPGSGTWNERIRFGSGEATPDRFVLLEDVWTPIIMRDVTRFVLTSGDWQPLVHTNGAWTIHR